MATLTAHAAYAGLCDVLQSDGLQSESRRRKPHSPRKHSRDASDDDCGTEPVRPYRPHAT
eukprot:3457325-Prymnesium_polylepis.2